MQSKSDQKIVVVKRATRLLELIRRFNTLGQVEFYITAMGGDFEDYLEENRIYDKALKTLCQQLETMGNVQVVDRAYLSNFIFGTKDIVVVIGQDGLVANTLKYLDGQPVIGVNPDKNRWDGLLLPFEVADMKTVIGEVTHKGHTMKKITMAEVVLNDGQHLYAVNDFYIGQKTHVSSRYILNDNNISERQSSSGIIVSTGLGSTGWMRSVMVGAANVSNYTEGDNGSGWQSKTLSWDAKTLLYAVREPFPSHNTGTSLGFGTIDYGQPLEVSSLMSEGGVIFSDGMEEDYLDFNAGITAYIDVATKNGCLVSW